jgi:translation initiation factor IF-3
VTVKEVKFRPKIGKGDFDTKVRHMRDFLDDGHKVKVTLQFRGREVAHPELGAKILDAVLEQLGEMAKVETQARLEGRNMTMVLSPEKKSSKKSHSGQEVQEASAPQSVVASPVEPTDNAPTNDASIDGSTNSESSGEE